MAAESAVLNPSIAFIRSTDSIAHPTSDRTHFASDAYLTCGLVSDAVEAPFLTLGSDRSCSTVQGAVDAADAAACGKDAVQLPPEQPRLGDATWSCASENHVYGHVYPGE